MYSPYEDRAAIRLAIARRRELREKQRRDRRIRLRFYGFTAVFAVIAVLPRFFTEPGALGSGIEEPPPELVGKWTTDEPRYADRSLEIGTDVVAIDMGPGVREWYPILSTRSWAEVDYDAYAITYETVTGDELEVEVHLFSDGTLRLRNPPDVIWTRSSLTWRIRDFI